MTSLGSSNTVVGYSSAERLSGALTVNTRLGSLGVTTQPWLSNTVLGFSSAERLSGALTVNTRLGSLGVTTQPWLSNTVLGFSSAERLSGALMVNSGLGSLGVTTQPWLSNTSLPERLSGALMVNAGLGSLGVTTQPWLSNTAGYSSAERLWGALMVTSGLSSVGVTTQPWLSNTMAGYSSPASLSGALTVNSAVASLSATESLLSNAAVHPLREWPFGLTVNPALASLSVTGQPLLANSAVYSSREWLPGLTVDPALASLSATGQALLAHPAVHHSREWLSSAAAVSRAFGDLAELSQWRPVSPTEYLDSQGSNPVSTEALSARAHELAERLEALGIVVLRPLLGAADAVYSPSVDRVRHFCGSARRVLDKILDRYARRQDPSLVPWLRDRHPKLLDKKVYATALGRIVFALRCARNDGDTWTRAEDLADLHTWVNSGVHDDLDGADLERQFGRLSDLLWWFLTAVERRVT